MANFDSIADLGSSADDCRVGVDRWMSTWTGQLQTKQAKPINVQCVEDLEHTLKFGLPEVCVIFGTRFVARLLTRFLARCLTRFLTRLLARAFGPEHNSAQFYRGKENNKQYVNVIDYYLDNTSVPETCFN